MEFSRNRTLQSSSLHRRALSILTHHDRLYVCNTMTRSNPGQAGFCEYQERGTVYSLPRFAYDASDRTRPFP
jgi:hypothetical protein